MKNLLFLAGCFLASFSAVAQEKIVVDENVTSRDIEKFVAVEVSGGIDLYISQSNEIALAVSASEKKLVPYLKTEVKDGVLRIYAEKGMKSFNRIGKPLKAYISAPVLHRISASGACDVLISGVLKQDDLEINLSGSSDFKGTLEVKNLAVHQSGSSDSFLAGKAQHAKLEVSGASDIKAYGLETEYCKASASGASDIQISVNKEIAASASGASDIYFKGSATAKDIKQSGASTVARRS